MTLTTKRSLCTVRARPWSGLVTANQEKVWRASPGDDEVRSIEKITASSDAHQPNNRNLESNYLSFGFGLSERMEKHLFRRPRTMSPKTAVCSNHRNGQTGRSAWHKVEWWNFKGNADNSLYMRSRIIPFIAHVWNIYSYCISKLCFFVGNSSQGGTFFTCSNFLWPDCSCQTERIGEFSGTSLSRSHISTILIIKGWWRNLPGRTSMWSLAESPTVRWVVGNPLPPCLKIWKATGCSRPIWWVEIFHASTPVRSHSLHKPTLPPSAHQEQRVYQQVTWVECWYLNCGLLSV